MSFISPFLFAPFIIYIFNLMAAPLDLYIPFNIATILIVGFLRIFGLLLLIILLFIF